jgi:hypothetical protein
LQVQDTTGSDEEINAVPSSKTALVGKLAQVVSEIWMTLSSEVKKWLLNERKCQQKKRISLKSHHIHMERIDSKMSERNKNTSP